MVGTGGSISEIYRDVHNLWGEILASNLDKIQHSEKYLNAPIFSQDRSEQRPVKNLVGGGVGPAQSTRPTSSQRIFLPRAPSKPRLAVLLFCHLVGDDRARGERKKKSEEPTIRTSQTASTKPSIDLSSASARIDEITGMMPPLFPILLRRVA